MADGPKLLAACKGIARALQPATFDDDGVCLTWLVELDARARDALLTAIAKATSL